MCDEKKLAVAFYRSRSGAEPVRDGLNLGHMVLLHGFIKKTQKTPEAELDLARKRQKDLTL